MPAPSHGGAGVGGPRVRIGIMPDYGDDQDGVLLSGATDGGPAAKAGLKEGDIITAIDADKIESLGDYMTVLGKHKPGDVVKIHIEREKQPVELSATLADPKG